MIFSCDRDNDNNLIIDGYNFVLTDNGYSYNVFRGFTDPEYQLYCNPNYIVASEPFRTTDSVHRAIQVVYGNYDYYQVIDCIYSEF